MLPLSHYLVYRILKRNIMPWVLRMRVTKLVRSGKLEDFKLNSKKRECRVIDMVYLLGQYGKQLQVCRLLPLSVCYTPHVEYV